MFDNIFETVNSGFAQLIYEDFVRNPASVSPEWRAFFENGANGHHPTENGGTRDEGRETSTAALVTVARTDATSDSTTRPSSPVSPPAPPAISGTASPIRGPALRLLENMEASLGVPTATSFREVDVTRLWDTRASANAALAARGIKLSFTHLIGWALVRALREFPAMTHAVIQSDGVPHRLDPGAINFGLAVDVERKDGTRGLLVPIIKHADRLSFAQFHAEYERVVAGARDGKLLPDAYQGGTVTLTNPGTLGTSASVPRLMSGQGSIFATGAIRQIGTSRVMTVTSTYDHRIIQGAESGSFLRRVDELLQGSSGFYEEIDAAFGIAVSRVRGPVSAAPTVPSNLAASAPDSPPADTGHQAPDTTRPGIQPPTRESLDRKSVV